MYREKMQMLVRRLRVAMADRMIRPKPERPSLESLESRRLLAIPFGSETLVNTFTSDSQNPSSIAADANGDFVVTWTSYLQDGSGNGVYAQRFNSDGVKQGAEFRVNTTTAGDQDESSVAMDADGNFVIAWASTNQDGSGDGVYARRYNAAGVVQGGEFRVNAFTTNSQSAPSAAMDADGNFVIAWQSLQQDSLIDAGVFARRYNSSGTAQGTEFRVNTYTTGAQFTPAAAMSAEGDFVIVWCSFLQDGAGFGVYAQMYNDNGSTFGTEFRANSITAGDQVTPAVTMDADGDFLVVWSADGADGSAGGIRGQFFTPGGVGSGEGFINNFTTDQQLRPAVAAAGDGNFVVAWDSRGQDGSLEGVYAQKFTLSGPAPGAEFRVNTYTTFVQNNAAVAMDADGNFIVSWTSFDQDGSDGGVFIQQFTEPVLADGTLTIPGTPGKDTIALGRSGSIVTVIVNGQASIWDDSDIVHINIDSGDGNDKVTIGSGIVGTYVLGGAGNDTLTGGAGSDTLAGASGKDKLAGSGGNDVLRGGKHNDQVLGNDGDDRMYGDEADDSLDGGGGKDREYGGGGNDLIVGGNHNDILYGEAGNDSLDGGSHNDRLFPGPGQDTARGGKGDDGITDPDDNLIDLLDGGPDTDFVDAGNEDILANFED